ncbi:HD-GYP domain-containing protein [Paenibacillus chungangensis]|uniref:HD-GYP domain-containing protein n=1 Tax=Paenibacillus chungangensis TaxID=696535 RepID=A0ABW3HLD5_9BACL
MSLLRIHVTEIIEGDQLINDIFNNYGLHVLSNGTRLYKKEVSRLLQHQIDFVEILDREATDKPEKRTLESTVTPKWLPTVGPVYESAVNCFQQLFEQALESGTIDTKQVQSVTEPLLNNLQLERDVVSMLLLLNSHSSYTYQHSVQVSMLSYYLATWLGYSLEEATLIGQAGFLHDIGKCRIPESILNKPAKLTEHEFAEVKLHTVYGHEIILGSFQEELLAIAALQHHERIDGSGYPNGLKGDEIHPIAMIIAVVDIYSAMISTRVYQQERDLLYVLRELYRLSFDQLDPNTTHTFIKHMIPNFIGKKVRMNNDQYGIIVMTHPTDFFRPLIQIGDTFIDLTQERGYEIVHVYM